MNLLAKPRYYGPPSLCSRCGVVLAAALKAAGYARHPLCAPDEQPWEWRDGRPLRDRREEAVQAAASRQEAARLLRSVRRGA